ncbi:hypothetical protein [Streptomyces virginiae]|uniref:hypothetical protein n=1 Tax=Streptomyces virginiae TaxID=1961 RepID=UPI002259157A|nr:hypothetical protein [Streptomyces virginiae]MCX4960116.1 hypothetical protein [Streptomyces virginiae]
MRLAHHAAAPLAALLILAASQPAEAARGAFTFRFTAAGQSRAGALDNPADGVCIDATASMGGFGRARAARNTTDRTVTLHMSIDCEDDGVVLRPGARRSAEFKTVRFG